MPEPYNPSPAGNPSLIKRRSWPETQLVKFIGRHTPKCPEVVRILLRFMQHYDLLVSPVCPFGALPHGRTFDEDRFPGFSYTMTHNLTGWPVAVIRAGTTSDKLPIGAQLAGRPWREDVVLATARFLATAFGEWPRPMS